MLITALLRSRVPILTLTRLGYAGVEIVLSNWYSNMFSVVPVTKISLASVPVLLKKIVLLTIRSKVLDNNSKPPLRAATDPTNLFPFSLSV